MSTIKDPKKLFFVTSPRSPLKMIPEIKLLSDNFEGEKWNHETQSKFAKLLAESNYFNGDAKNDKGFSARDRITRGPKGLGFLDLSPNIKLTDPGKYFINSDRPNEIFTRQLLKFQLPSHFHKVQKGKVNNYNIKPFLEMLRLVYDLESLSKDEIKLFGLRLLNYKDYDCILNEIKEFRENRKKIDRSKSNYKIYKNQIFDDIFNKMYSDELKQLSTTPHKAKAFTKTTKQTMNDYADACFRYLRATELVTTNRQGNYLIIPNNKVKEVEFILNTVKREPTYFKSLNEFKDYLYNPTLPVLAIDNREELIKILTNLGIDPNELSNKTILELQDLKHKIELNKTKENVERSKLSLKTYSEYNNIIDIYNSIKSKDVVDAPLMLEWNTWRAFTMLNDGNINGNFKVDIEGMPLSTAGGKMADIECYYNDFNLIIEVTTATGEKQYDMEGEPVARHLGDLKLKNTDKEAYCIFIASTKVSEGTLAHFYSLHNINIKRYGGTSKIIPLSLDMFLNFLECANKNRDLVSSLKLKSYLDKVCDKVNDSEDEEEWFKYIEEISKNWI